MTPKISIVVTARNDDYGGNSINRISAGIKAWDYFANKYRTVVEYILVEYNYVENKVFLCDDLIVPKSEYFVFRTIFVPPSFHKDIDGAEGLTICEFIAKNIGIRRAKAEFILAMNPDVVVSEEVFKYITDNTLDPKKFYRVNRCDTSVKKVDLSMEVPEIEEFLSKNVTRILYNLGTKYVSWKNWFHTFIHGRTLNTLLRMPILESFKTFNDKTSIHGNAAGDFLLTKKENWEKIGGYDETPTGTGIYDSYAMYMLHCMGLEQQILNGFIYHLDHYRNGAPYRASMEKFVRDAKVMLETRKPYRKVDASWGFPSVNFEEIVR